jgi:uncharacterized protein
MNTPVFVPLNRVPAETLQGLLEDFATRAGTDYGDKELDLAARVDMIRRQLHAGEAVLMYLPMDELLHIVTRQEAKSMGFRSEDY